MRNVYLVGKRARNQVSGQAKAGQTKSKPQRYVKANRVDGGQ